jgi:hypothetical protein
MSRAGFVEPAAMERRIARNRCFALNGGKPAA